MAFEKWTAYKLDWVGLEMGVWRKCKLKSPLLGTAETRDDQGIRM